jgi:hypothetical protein
MDWATTERPEAEDSPATVGVQPPSSLPRNNRDAEARVDDSRGIAGENPDFLATDARGTRRLTARPGH